MTKKQTAAKRAPLTTEELERLTADEFVRLKLTEDEMARLREINKVRERERQASVARIRVEEAPMVAELQAAGLKIRSVGDLMNRRERYAAAIPILLKHLQMPYSDFVREAIARTLAVAEPEVQKAWPILAEEYRKAPMGWGIKGPGGRYQGISARCKEWFGVCAIGRGYRRDPRRTDCYRQRS